ncbi:hypothetical protein ABPG75_011299 [Micractinium tetrahymenae]
MQGAGQGLEADLGLRLPLLEQRDDGLAVCADVELEEGSPTEASLAGTTLLQTTGNILNVFVGTGLLSMPFALRMGGWVALGVQALLLPLFALSGQLIVWAFDLLPAAVPRTYPELGRAAAGRHGVRAVMIFSFLELFGGSCILLMVAWRMAELLLPPGLGLLSTRQLAAAVVSWLLLPILFVDIRKGLSRLSAVGLSSCLLVIAMTLALLALDPHRTALPQQPPPGHHVISPGIIQAVGVFALSATAHSTLPALRTAMRKPSQFPAAIGSAFSIMLAGYTTLAAVGYWYFGDAASPLITTDLSTSSVYRSFRRLPVDRVLAAFVLVNTLCKYPSLNLVLQDMILSVLPLTRDEQGSFHPPLHWAAYALRLGLFAAGCTLGLTAYDALGSALSLLGGLGSISCSLVLPTVFYSLLAWRRSSRPARCGLAALLLLGAGLVVLVTGMNICELSQRCGGGHAGGGAGGGQGR